MTIIPDDRIVTTAPPGVHIPLTCVNHPDLRWSTKNISFIGARTIFFDLFNKCPGGECPCSGRDLIPVAQLLPMLALEVRTQNPELRAIECFRIAYSIMDGEVK